MRANEFLNEVDVLSYNGSDAVKGQETVTITIPRELLKIDGGEHTADVCEECGYEVAECECGMCHDEIPGEVHMHEGEEQQDEEITVSEPVEPEGEDDLSAIVRLSGAKTPTGGARGASNHTIAAPATGDVPENPVFVSPLQQQLELQKQQGGKESPVINQIIDDSILGSTAGEQPEQSVYHDSPLKDNEWVGAGTGEVDNLANKTTTQGATKPWYKL